MKRLIAILLVTVLTASVPVTVYAEEAAAPEPVLDEESAEPALEAAEPAIVEDAEPAEGEAPAEAAENAGTEEPAIVEDAAPAEGEATAVDAENQKAAGKAEPGSLEAEKDADPEDIILEEQQPEFLVSGDWEYEIVGGKAVLRVYGGGPNVVIPSTIEGYTVTTLGIDMLYGRDDIKSVVIPNTVTTIKEYAFYECVNLSSVKWGSNIKTIEKNAFSECHKLETVNLPESVKSIGDGAFQEMNSLKSLTIPKNVTYVGVLAFADNRKLEEINYNAVDCDVFGDETFRKAGMHSETLTVNIGKGVKKVPDMFMCSVDGENIVYVTKLVLSSTVEEIGEYAFMYCEDLSDITWPTGLKKICAYAFGYCSSIKSIVFPRDLHTVEDYAFNACTALKSVSFPSGVVSVEYAFGECSSIKKGYFFGKTTDVAPWIFDTVSSTVTVYCYKNSPMDSIAKNEGYKIVYLTRSSYFPDVPPDHSYQKAVYWACDAGIAAGYNNGRFGVADDITRGQVVVFLWRLAGKPEPKKNTQTFSDVPTTHNFYKAIQWASEKKITAGYSNGKFGVNDNCTRGQIVTFLWRYKKKPKPASMVQQFTDVPTTHSYFSPIQWASEKGIAAGYSNGTFKPKNTCTRGQCVTFLYRMIS